VELKEMKTNKVEIFFAAFEKDNLLEFANVDNVQHDLQKEDYMTCPRY
jgi:hypothetical protein